MKSIIISKYHTETFITTLKSNLRRLKPQINVLVYKIDINVHEKVRKLKWLLNFDLNYNYLEKWNEYYVQRNTINFLQISIVSLNNSDKRTGLMF